MMNHSSERSPSFLLGYSFRTGVALAALVAGCVAWAGDPSMAQRDAWNLVRSDFALAAQAAAKPLGDLSFNLPLPTSSQNTHTPVIDGVLDEDVWFEATEVPLPCVRRGPGGRIVADARLLALSANGRVFVALTLPRPAGSTPLLSFEPTAGFKGLTVTLKSDGKVVGTQQKGGQNGQSSPLQSAKARGTDVVVVELELALPEGQIVIRPKGEAFGLRPPHPLSEPTIRFHPDEIAWRLTGSDGEAGRRVWRLTVGRELVPPSALAGVYAACRGFGNPISSGKLEVSANVENGRSVFTLRAPAAIGATLLKITSQKQGRSRTRQSSGPTRKRPNSGEFGYSVICAAYVPDAERLVKRTRLLVGEGDLRPSSETRLFQKAGFLQRLGELGRRLESLRLRLGTATSLRAFDEAYREALSLRREMVLCSPLLDFERLVFVKRHNFGGWDGFFGYTSYLKPLPAELCVLSTVREGLAVRTLLRTDTGCIRDPDVSFDGRRVLFAYARNPQDTYHLYEIGADGTGLRQLTFSPPYSGAEPAPRGVGFQDVEPCYLPSGDIAFTSTRYVRYVDCVGQGEPVTTLFVMNGDGKLLRGISANHVHDWCPSVLNDGRLIYTRWEYTDRSQMWTHQLFAKNPDGSGTVNVYGSNSWWPVSMLHARAIPGSDRIVCTLAGHHSGTEQAGEIAVIDRRRGTEDAAGVVALFPPRKIEPIYADVPRPANAWYGQPYPLSERRFIVSGRPPGCERFGLYVVDVYGNRVLLFEDDSLDARSPMPLAPRPLPPVISPRTDYRKDAALVSLIDIYRGPGLHGVKRGTVRALRIIDFDVRDTPETGGLRQENGPSGGHSCPVSALGGSWHVKRIVGTVPVYEDGSALFRIPAERRVFFQPLDEQGRALQSMRSWVEPMPGETITCVGCHESPSQAPLNRQTIALSKGPLDPAPWYGPPRAFGFRREVQPVLDRYCVSCHNERDEKGLDLRGDATNWFSLAYENLRPFVKPIGPQGPPKMVAARSVGAVASPLVQMLLDGHQDVTLDPESLDRIITWIDLNIPYYDNTAVTRPHGAFGNSSGRAIVSGTDAKPLWAAFGNRCRSCHAAGFRLDPAAPPCQVPDLPHTMTRPCLNLTHPEQSRILSAPLARAAGGLGLCGKGGFVTREDPTYQAALRVIQGWHKQMLAHPREDMRGSEPCQAYTATLAKRQAWQKIEASNRRALAGK